MEKNVSVRINRNTVIFIRPDQDPEKMREKFIKKYMESMSLSERAGFRESLKDAEK